MNIKTFKDGQRLVIVVEGLENVPSDADILKAFLSATIQGEENSIESVKDPDAVPVPPAEDVMPQFSVQDSDPAEIEVETSFFKGKLTDSYGLIDSIQKEIEVLKSLGDSAEVYLRHKFSKIDADEYANKLSPVQKEKFFSVYGPFLYPELVENRDIKAAIEYYQ